MLEGECGGGQGEKQKKQIFPISILFTQSRHCKFFHETPKSSWVKLGWS